MSEASMLTTVIDTTPLAGAEVAAIEAAEARAWIDCYAAAPAAFAERAGLDARVIVGAAAIRWAATGRRYFSRAIGLAVVEPATPEALDELFGWWQERGITMFLLQSLPQCRPAGYEDWLRERGLEPFDRQDRIVRGDAPPPPPPPNERGLVVERVTGETAGEWSDFIQRTYGLDTGDWLPRLIGRQGWHAYVAREHDEIVAARTMYAGDDGYAWLGMDAPVPGLMTPDFEPDLQICHAIVSDGLGLGVKRFLADIEAPSDALDTPAYANFAELGFTRPYVRTHWARVA